MSSSFEVSVPILYSQIGKRTEEGSYEDKTVTDKLYTYKTS